jgi:hypothetical protein
MTNKHILILLFISVLPALSCQSGAEAFVDGRGLSICDEAYQICDVPAGCVLDRDHYVEGAFPGSRRFVVVTEERDVRIILRIFFDSQVAPGTRLLVHALEPDCSMDPDKAEAVMENVDIFKKAGSDKMLEFDLEVAETGEHLVEITSDAATEYLLTVDQKY